MKVLQGYSPLTGVTCIKYLEEPIRKLASQTALQDDFGKQEVFVRFEERKPGFGLHVKGGRRRGRTGVIEVAGCGGPASFGVILRLDSDDIASGSSRGLIVWEQE